MKRLGVAFFVILLSGAAHAQAPTQTGLTQEEVASLCQGEAAAFCSQYGLTEEAIVAMCQGTDSPTCRARLGRYVDDIDFLNDKSKALARHPEVIAYAKYMCRKEGFVPGVDGFQDCFVAKGYEWFDKQRAALMRPQTAPSPPPSPSTMTCIDLGGGLTTCNPN